MGSVLQFAAFFCICCLIRVEATHLNQNEDQRLNNKRSNPNSPGVGDIYFIEEKDNDDNVKTGRTISQSAWSKEDKEPTLPDENKTGTQFSDEFSIKSFLSYLLDAVHELKKDIFGIKEIALLKKTKESPNSQDSFENKDKQNQMEKNHDVTKHVVLLENSEFRNENEPPTSNYLTDYYQENGIKFTEDEETEDDLENFSDVSDDSSHKPNEGASMHEVSKSNENTHNFKCMKIKRKLDKYSFEAKKTTDTPTSETKISDGEVQGFDENKKSEKYGDCKEYIKKTKQKHSKAPREETENGTASPPNIKTRKCIKKNNKNSADSLNEKNEPTGKPLESAEYVKVVSPQNDNYDQEESKRSNQDKTVNDRFPGKNLKNIDSSDFDYKPGVLVQSTTVSSQRSEDVIFPQEENEPKASGASSEKQQEQIPSLKQEDKKRSQNNGKFLKDRDGINEHTTISFLAHKPVLEIPEHTMSTDAYTFDTEINNSPKESKEEGLKVISTQTIVTSNENKPISKTERQQTSDSFDSGNAIIPTTSGNVMNTEKLNKNTSDNLNDNKETNEREEPKKSSPNKQNKNNSETQRDGETEQTKAEKVNDDSAPEKSLKNERLIDSIKENDNKKKEDHLDSTTANDLPSQDLNREIQNNGNKGSDTPQKSSLSKQDKNNSETQRDGGIEQTKVEEVNDDSASEKSLKNKRLIDSILENDNKENDDHLVSTTTNDLPSQDLNREIQNHGNKRSDKPQKSSLGYQDKNNSKTQRDGETEQTKVEEVNDDSAPEKSLKNKRLIDSIPENDSKKVNDHLDSRTANDPPSQDSNGKIQNHGNEGSDKPQQNNKNQNERAEMQEYSPDEEYEFEEDTEDFDIWDELNDTQDSDQNQEEELDKDNGDQDEEKINPGNTGSVLTNESQISQHTEYVMEEKSQEQFDTFLEYFYKHSNNSFFQSLKNLSNSSSDDKDGY